MLGYFKKQELFKNCCRSVPPTLTCFVFIRQFQQGSVKSYANVNAKNSVDGLCYFMQINVATLTLFLELTESKPVNSVSVWNKRRSAEIVL